MMRVIIIEDEKLTAKDLQRTLLQIETGIEDIAFLHSVEEATQYFKTNPSADLIFSDIELGDGLSFDIFNKVPINIPIIFCTAYNHYALDAFKTFGIDYVLKPFDTKAIEKALLKYHSIKASFNTTDNDLGGLLESLKQSIVPQVQSIVVHQGEKIIPLNSNEIALFFIENEYCFAYTFSGKKYLISQNMEQLEKTFSPRFFRANRQFIINRKAVKDASQYFNRKLLVNLTIPFNEQIIIGKLKISSFTQWLSKH
jgi:two-component system, LytTR family, response regulator LytT